MKDKVTQDNLNSEGNNKNSPENELIESNKDEIEKNKTNEILNE